jgi:hypothetical protein
MQKYSPNSLLFNTSPLAPSSHGRKTPMQKLSRPVCTRPVNQSLLRYHLPRRPHRRTLRLDLNHSRKIGALMYTHLMHCSRDLKSHFALPLLEPIRQRQQHPGRDRHRCRTQHPVQMCLMGPISQHEHHGLVLRLRLHLLRPKDKEGYMAGLRGNTSAVIGGKAGT